MSKKPPSISFKPVSKNKPCKTIINGGLKVKKNIVAECDLKVKKCLNVKNIVYSNTETITESGQTVSGVKSLSWINTNGTGVLSDNTKDGFYKKVIKISEGSTTEGWTSVGQTSDITYTRVHSICCNNQNDELYILTDSVNIAGIPGLNFVAKWTGSGWESLGATGQITLFISDLQGEQDLCCDNEGNIYLSTGQETFDIIFSDFSTKLAKFDVSSSSWTTVGDNSPDGGVYSICCNSNDGNLYIGGDFTNVDGVAVGKLAKYNDTDGWSSVGGLISGGGAVYKVCCDSKDGSIYIGGSFSNLTTEGLNKLGKYNDIDGWTSVGQTSDIINGIVYDICCDSENGDIYIAGSFENVSGITGLDNVAKWDAKSQSWTSVGNTGDFNLGGSQVVYSICCKNGEIYVGGDFTNVAGLGINNLAKWTGSSWTSVGGPSDINSVWVEDICCDTKNGEIYVGGSFNTVAGITGLNNLARFDQAQNYTLTYNTTDEVTLTNVGENACFIYNESLGEWVKI